MLVNRWLQGLLGISFIFQRIRLLYKICKQRECGRLNASLYRDTEPTLEFLAWVKLHLVPAEGDVTIEILAVGESVPRLDADERGILTGRRPYTEKWGIEIDS
mgnify:CR=1 FL=1